MSKIFQLLTDLKLCYATKVPTAEEYVKLTEYERNLLCDDVRKALINYMNSDEYCFYDILKEKLQKIESKK